MSRKEQVLAALRAAIEAVEAGRELEEVLMTGEGFMQLPALAWLEAACASGDGSPNEDLSEMRGAVVVPYCRVVESVEPDEDGGETYRYRVEVGP
jgi:hypothetical protein